MILIKIVDKQLQPLSLGLMRCINILLAYIPAPIAFSKLIDGTCILWNVECNDDQGTCLEYDLTQFHRVFLGVGLGIKGVSFIVLIIIFIYVHKKKVFRARYSSKFNLDGNTKSKSKNKRISGEVADISHAHSNEGYVNDSTMIKSKNLKSKNLSNNNSSNSNSSSKNEISFISIKSVDTTLVDIALTSFNSSTLTATTASTSLSTISSPNGTISNRSIKSTISNLNSTNPILTSTLKTSETLNVLALMDTIYENEDIEEHISGETATSL